MNTGSMIRGLALQPTWPYAGEVARSLLGVLIAVAAALWWAPESTSVGAAIAAGGSAAIAGATALQDSPHGRLPLVVGVSLGMGAAVLLGSLTSPYSALFVVVVALWCFAAGLLWAVSANAGLVASAASALLVTCPPSGVSPAGAVGAGLLAVAGGLTQAVLVAAWPRQRWREQRDALRDAYRAVAGQASKLAADPSATFDPTPLIALREAFTLTERQARRRPPAYRGLYGLPERISLTISALRANAGLPAVAETLVSAGAALQAIAEPGPSARTEAQSALRRMDVTVQRLGTESPVSVVPAQRLIAQLREACALHFIGTAEPAGRVEELRRPGIVGSLRAARRTVRSHLDPESPIFRHAVRLAVAAAAGTAFARVTGMSHGFWIALTVLMVLRPETAHTYTRCVSRLVGTIAGVTVATTVTILIHPTGLVSAVLAVVFLGVAYAVSGIGYVPLSAALAAAIVFLVDITDVADGGTIRERVVATLIGGALAVASHVVLPDRSLVRLHQRAGELLKAEIDYAATVIKAFVHPLDDPDEAMAVSWRRADRARSAFEAASGTVRADTPEVRRWLRSYRAALNAVTGTCAALETYVRAVPAKQLDPQFVLAVDEYADALRGETPSAGQAWHIDAAHLTEADQQLRDVAPLLGPDHAAQRVLVAELATITRHLLALADGAAATAS